MTQRLPGITELTFLPADALIAHILYRAQAGLNIPIYARPESIPHIGDALCVTETEFDNNATRATTKLTFSTTAALPEHIPLCFIIRTVAGPIYIIGTREAPYPIITMEETTGSPDADKAVRKYTVTYTNTKSIISCTA